MVSAMNAQARKPKAARRTVATKIACESAALACGLAFLPLTAEHFDLVVCK
jgi:hypothetical protein